MRFLSFLCALLFSFSALSAQKIKIDFSTDLYSHSPLGKLKSATMKLWSIVDHASSHASFDAVAVLEHDLFLQQLLALNSLLDSTTVHLEQHTSQDKAHYAHSIEDMRHILDVFKLITERYKAFYDSHDALKEKDFIMYLLDFITEKIDTFITVEED